MVTTPVLSQRDPRWAWKTLGFVSATTIGGYGCLLSCLTMLAGRNDVAEVNELFKQKGVYWDGNLVLWYKVQDALTNLKIAKLQQNVYDNNDVRAWIYDRKFPVVVKVDAGPIGAPRSDHYVLFVGDGKLVDPWTGRVRSTSDFPIVKGYALYEVTQTQVPLNDQQKINEIVKIMQSGDNSDSKVSKTKSILGL